MIKKFYEFKDSLKTLGEIVKKDIVFIDKEKAEIFFEGYYKSVREIINFLVHDPKTFAKYVIDYKCFKKYNFTDFCHNVPVLLYPFYLPLSSHSISSFYVK